MGHPSLAQWRGRAPAGGAQLLEVNEASTLGSWEGPGNVLTWGMFSVYFGKLAKVRYICIIFLKNESPNSRIAGRLRMRKVGGDMWMASAVTLAPDMRQGHMILSHAPPSRPLPSHL